VGKTNTAVTTNATISPEGVQNASLVYPTASSSTKWGVMLQEFLTGITSASYTNTFYLKSNGWRWVYLIDASGAKNVWFDLQEGVVGTQEGNATGEIQAMGDGWYKCIITPHTTPTTYTYAGLFFSDADNSYVCTASGTNGVYVYAAQSEAGSYSTSYIPTYGTSATRTADACIKTGISSLIGQTEGTIYAEVDFDSSVDTEGYIVRIDESSFNDTIYVARGGDKILSGVLRSGGSTIAQLQKTAFNGVNKLAFAYKSGSFALYVNGTQVATSAATYTNGTTYDEIRIGGFSANTANMCGGVKQTLLFKTRLSNSDLAALTSL